MQLKNDSYSTRYRISGFLHSAIVDLELFLSVKLIGNSLIRFTSVVETTKLTCVFKYKYKVSERG